MRIFKSVAILGVVVSIGIGGVACRKRRPAAPSPSEVPETATSLTPAPSSEQAPVKSVPALSAKDETEIRKRFVPSGVPWAQKTPDQKQMAYFGWCQVYMLGDAATKAKVIAEINQAGLSAEDREALKKRNRDMRTPLLPL